MSLQSMKINDLRIDSTYLLRQGRGPCGKAAKTLTHACTYRKRLCRAEPTLNRPFAQRSGSEALEQHSFV